MGIDPVYSMDSNDCGKDIIPISYQIFFSAEYLVKTIIYTSCPLQK